MDGGRIVFLPNSKINTRLGMSFQNSQNYCVAPITTVNSNGTFKALAIYDFWAIGINCCAGDGSNFHCGEYNDKMAHAGLRLMRDDMRPFFRLAVQQAQASHGIKANHPLFFYWMKDPLLQAHSYEAEGYKYLLLGLCAHFSLQILLVLLAALTFARTNWV